MDGLSEPAFFGMTREQRRSSVLSDSSQAPFSKRQRNERSDSETEQPRIRQRSLSPVTTPVPNFILHHNHFRHPIQTSEDLPYLRVDRPYIIMGDYAAHAGKEMEGIETAVAQQAAQSSGEGQNQECEFAWVPLDLNLTLYSRPCHLPKPQSCS